MTDLLREKAQHKWWLYTVFFFSLSLTLFLSQDPFSFCSGRQSGKEKRWKALFGAPSSGVSRLLSVCSSILFIRQVLTRCSVFFGCTLLISVYLNRSSITNRAGLSITKTWPEHHYFLAVGGKVIQICIESRIDGTAWKRNRKAHRKRVSESLIFFTLLYHFYSQVL